MDDQISPFLYFSFFINVLPQTLHSGGFMSGTNFRSGVSVRQQYSGTDVQGDKSRLDAATKLISKTAVIRCQPLVSAAVTTFILPAQAIVRSVMVNVIVPGSGETVNIGTSEGTSNDFLAFALIDNAGLIMGDLVDGAITRGVLLYEETGVGLDVAYARRPDITSGGRTVAYSKTGGTNLSLFDIIVEYDEVVNEVQ